MTVIPALMISISGGMIVTRASSDNRLGVEFQKQIFGTSQPLLLASGVLIALALFPGLPKIPFLLLGAGLGHGRLADEAERGDAKQTAGRRPPKPKPQKENLEDLLRVEPLAVEVGVGLVKFIADGANSPLLRRIAGIRKQLATDLGLSAARRARVPTI